MSTIAPSNLPPSPNQASSLIPGNGSLGQRNISQINNPWDNRAQHPFAALAYSILYLSLGVLTLVGFTLALVGSSFIPAYVVGTVSCLLLSKVGPRVDCDSVFLVPSVIWSRKNNAPPSPPQAQAQQPPPPPQAQAQQPLPPPQAQAQQPLPPPQAQAQQPLPPPQAQAQQPPPPPQAQAQQPPPPPPPQPSAPAPSSALASSPPSSSNASSIYQSLADGFRSILTTSQPKTCSKIESPSTSQPQQQTVPQEQKQSAFSRLASFLTSPSPLQPSDDNEKPTERPFEIEEENNGPAFIDLGAPLSDTEKKESFLQHVTSYFSSLSWPRPKDKKVEEFEATDLYQKLCSLSSRIPDSDLDSELDDEEFLSTPLSPPSTDKKEKTDPDPSPKAASSSEGIPSSDSSLSNQETTDWEELNEASFEELVKEAQRIKDENNSPSFASNEKEESESDDIHASSGQHSSFVDSHLKKELVDKESETKVDTPLIEINNFSTIPSEVKEQIKQFSNANLPPLANPPIIDGSLPLWSQLRPELLVDISPDDNYSSNEEEEKSPLNSNDLYTDPKLTIVEAGSDLVKRTLESEFISSVSSTASPYVRQTKDLFNEKLITPIWETGLGMAETAKERIKNLQDQFLSRSIEDSASVQASPDADQGPQVLVQASPAADRGPQVLAEVTDDEFDEISLDDDSNKGSDEPSLIVLQEPKPVLGETTMLGIEPEKTMLPDKFISSASDTAPSYATRTKSLPDENIFTSLEKRGLAVAKTIKRKTKNLQKQFSSSSERSWDRYDDQIPWEELDDESPFRGGTFPPSPPRRIKPPLPKSEATPV